MSYASIVLADHPTGFWQLGEASGTSAADSSGNSYTGTNSSTGITYGTAGPLPRNSSTGYTFDGSNGMVTLPTSFNPTGWTAFSIEIFFKPATTIDYTQYPRLVGNNWLQSTSIKGFELLLCPGGANGAANLNIGCSNGAWPGITVTQGSGGTGTFTKGQWYHLVCTWNGATADNYAYVNGVQTNYETNQTGAIASVTANPVYIAHVPNVSNFAGTIAFVSIWNTVLSAQQVANHYRAATTLDLSTRLRLSASRLSMLSTRMRLSAARLSATSMRLRLSVPRQLSLAMRLALLAAQSSQRILASRIRLQAQVQRDETLRIKVGALQQRLLTLRSRLSALQQHDASTRLRLSALQRSLLTTRLTLVVSRMTTLRLRLGASILPLLSLRARLQSTMRQQIALRLIVTGFLTHHLPDIQGGTAIMVPLVPSSLSGPYLVSGVALDPPVQCSAPQLQGGMVQTGARFELIFQSPSLATQQALATMNVPQAMQFYLATGKPVTGQVVITSWQVGSVLLVQCTLAQPVATTPWVISTQFF